MIYLNKIYTYIHTYIHTHTHTHTYIYIYIYIYIYVYSFIYFSWMYNQPHAINLKVMILKQTSKHLKD